MMEQVQTGTKVRQSGCQLKLGGMFLKLSGFVANEEKSQWHPVQCGELLGYIMDL